MIKPLKVLTMPRYGWLPNIHKVQIQTHTRCSADCWFCPYIESDFVQAKSSMKDETWRLILDNLLAFKDGLNGPAGKVCCYLMQEPLIDKTIFSKIADVYKYFPNTCVEISTNGTALTEKVVDNLLLAFSGKKHDLWISHHGIDKETFEYIMKIDYEKSTANLLNLLKKADGKFNIKIRGAGESRDGKHFKFSCQQYLEYWDNLIKEHNINRNNVSIDAFTFHDRAGTLHRTDRQADTLNSGTIRKIDQQHPFYCDRADEWLHFMWNGDIRLCCMDYHGEVKLPNIHNVSLLDYFHGDEYTALVEHVSGRKACSPNFICSKCESPGG